MTDILKEQFNRYKYSPIGFFTGVLLIILTIIVPMDSFIEKGISTYYIRCIIYIIVIVIWLIIWYKTKEFYPKNDKNKIGIFVSITTENDKQKIRIKNDFIKGMIDIAKKNNYGDLLKVICIEDIKAKKANEIIDRYILSYQNAVKSNGEAKYHSSKPNILFNKFIKKTKGHLYIYGAIKERQDEGNKYYLSIDAYIRHRPININISNKISKDFQAIFPKEISFYSKYESKGFQFASDVVFLASRYMIGVAAMISFDPFTAYTIHRGLQLDLQKYNPQPPNIKYISEKLNNIIADELLQQSKYYYFKKDYDTAKRLIEEAIKFDVTNYNVYIFKSFIAFELDDDLRKALEYCDKAKAVANGNGTWLYNQAFLYMYLEEFPIGYNAYKLIKESNFIEDNLTFTECISFNEDYIKKYPMFYQSLFILGYLYYFKKNNLPLALDKFELFVDETNKLKKFKFLRDKAISFISDIKKDIKLQ
ncbi:MAG: hypothetical protein JXA06_11465 [Bacteroidetes bacterium]|nr:hypothetical protein [Bacteroidota bacterium]